MNNKFYNLLKQKPIVITQELLKHYRKINLTHEELVLVLQFQIEHVTIEQVALQMGITVPEVLSLLSVLIQKKLVTTKMDEQTNQVVYLFDNIFQNLAQLLLSNTQQETIVIKQEDIADLMQMFSTEFGRNLSPTEFDMITSWLQDDKYSISLIKEALKEAVLSNVYNLRYMDRILLEWDRKQIKTVEQVKQQKQQYKREQSLDTKIELTDEIVNLLSQDWLSH